jgi:hypothetical protein
MAHTGEDLLPFFREGGDGVNGWLLRYLCGPASTTLP